MGRTNYDLSRPGFYADYESVDRSSRQVDFANVPDSFKNSDGAKVVPSGTIMSEQADGTIIPRNGATDGSDNPITASSILETAAIENSRAAAINGQSVIIGGVLYKTLLPDADQADFETWLTELKDAGTGFVFETYADDRSS